MTQFRANELQKALFIEVMDDSLSDSGDYLARHPRVVHAWLLQAKPILVDLARLGRSAVRNGRSDYNTMLVDFTKAMDPLPHDVLRWLNNYNCLRNLVSPDSLRGLGEQECRSRFQALATLDAGL